MYAGTGVAYGEMMTYTYWCVEKGYARNVGENQPGEEWAQRARGWIRVMYTDVWITMVVYTLSTVCFYLLGATILYANDVNPDGVETLAVLGMMYTETLGDWSAQLFIIGAFFVLFSTVVASTAGYSRLLADGLTVMGLVEPGDYRSRLRFIRIFIIVSLVLYATAYWLFENPPQMLLITSSVIAALMYPIIGFGTLYLRYCDVDARIVPGRLTTLWLWICGVALIVISPSGILLALMIQFGWIAFGP
jgi:Mn2+/Fe2+ NRAMP family transporter